METHLIAIADISGSMRARPLDNVSATKMDMLNLGLSTMAEIISTCGPPNSKNTMAVIAFNGSSRIIYEPKCPSDTLNGLTELRRTIHTMTARGTNSFTKALSDVLEVVGKIIKSSKSNRPMIQAELYTDGIIDSDDNETRESILTMAKTIMETTHQFKCDFRLNVTSMGNDIDVLLCSKLAETCNGVYKHASDPTTTGTNVVSSAVNHLYSRPFNLPRVEVPQFMEELKKTIYLHLEGAGTINETFTSCQKIVQKEFESAKTHPVYLDREQLEIAVSKQEFFVSWGIPFIISLHSAHANENTGDFKNPGTQHYGSKRHEMFERERDKGDLIFKKQLKEMNFTIYDQSGKAEDSAVAAKKIEEILINPDGGCFAGMNTVEKLDNTATVCSNGMVFETVYVKDVVVGDMLRTMSVSCDGHTLIESVGEVEHIMLTQNSSSLVDVYKNGFYMALITKNHPVTVNGTEWEHPCKMEHDKKFSTEDVYSFAFAKHCPDGMFPSAPKRPVAVKLNGAIYACALAHGLTGDVIEHRSYGTEVIIGFIDEYSRNYPVLDKKTGIFNVTELRNLMKYLL